ncbi:hypothetical protein A0J61_09708 [Choanephora cucurbitarum]|uniref:Uncharacterized protein n=1 Tax=Choanephora cucurbitarum TaxID=101091 RepID=A0A1C7MZP7_9FUNG|nr:hypothetical protein A0J61_09708 [Choanephora cucurbitarum]
MGLEPNSDKLRKYMSSNYCAEIIKTDNPKRPFYLFILCSYAPEETLGVTKPLQIGSLSLDTNHEFLTFSFDLPCPEHHQPPPQRVMWRLNRLKKDPSRTKYEDTFHLLADNPLFTSPPALSDPASASAYIEKFNDQLCDSIYTSLDQSCGRTPLELQDFMKDF